MSQSSDNFTRHFEEVPQILDYFDSQTYPKNLQEPSIFCSLRQLNEHYQSHHHNNQLPTDQFVMNRPDVSLTSRPAPYKPYGPRSAAIGLPVDPLLRAFMRNPHHSLPKATSDASATANNIRIDYARNRVPRLHRSSSLSGREVFEQEQTQSSIDVPQVIRPTPYKLYDPRYADIGLPVDPYLRAFKQNPIFGLAKRATSDEKS